MNVDFFKRLGIVAGAIIAVATIISWISGHAWHLAINPVLDALANERRERVTTDSLLVRRLEGISHDRLDLIDIMLTPPGPGREKKLQAIRLQWRHEE